jgi:hypothetical protein
MQQAGYFRVCIFTVASVLACLVAASAVVPWSGGGSLARSYKSSQVKCSARTLSICILLRRGSAATLLDTFTAPRPRSRRRPPCRVNVCLGERARGGGGQARPIHRALWPPTFYREDVFKLRHELDLIDAGHSVEHDKG